MAKLISVRDVEELAKKGEKTIYLDGSTLITPAAKDAAAAEGIAIVCGGGSDVVDSNLIYNALTALVDKGVLKGVIDDAGAPAAGEPYTAERDPAGLKIVRGGSVKLEYLDTGNPANQVHYREVICSKESSVMNTGFLEIDSCRFDWNVGCDEMYYIIQGPLSITVNGKTYTAYTGDVVNLPLGSKIVLEAKGKAKMFYSIKAA
jgi:ethanolamine utilization protein EutQ